MPRTLKSRVQKQLTDRLRSRPRIGIVMRSFRRPDHDIWLGATEAAREAGLDVITFTGQALQSPVEFQGEANAVYELIHAKQFDGILLLTSGIGLYVGLEGMQAFCERFGTLPLVSVQTALPGHPSILVDNYQGMREMMDHLIGHHGYRRIAFLRGPITHRGARERYRAYTEALEAHGLPFDPGLVTPPAEGWDNQVGIRDFLARHWEGPQSQLPEAVVGTSANLAEQGLSWLLDHGVRVPEDVAVTGFDDFPHLGGIMPPLTTTRVPFAEIGQHAISLLLAQMRGETVPIETTFPARIVIRESCGCPSQALLRASASWRHTTRSTAALPPRETSASEESSEFPQPLLMARRAELVAAVTPTLDGDDGTTLRAEGSWASELVDAFIHDLTTHMGRANASTAATLTIAPQDATFLSTLRQILIRAAEADQSLSLFQDVISDLRQAALTPLLEIRQTTAGIQVVALIEDLLGQARVLISEMARTADTAMRVKLGRQSVSLARVGHTLTTVTDFENLRAKLGQELTRTDIRGCYLVLYEDPRKPAEWARLRFAGPGERDYDVPEEGLHFPAQELLPTDVWTDIATAEPFSLVIEPLYTRRKQFGFIVFMAGPRDILFEDQPEDSTIYDMLRSYISDALHGILLYDEAVRARQQAEEADRLKSRFLSMVSHELRTPLNVIVSLSEILTWREDGYQEELTRIHASAQHLDGLIRDVLDLASSQVGQLRLVREPLDLRQVLEVVVIIGEQMARDKGLVWRAQVPRHVPRVWGDRTRLRQVALNLVSNAFRFTSQGEVSLSLEVGEGEITVRVSDTGLGVPTTEQEMIFDEFRQSERTAARGYGGLGLGLAISRRLVEMHGGTIGVHSSGMEGEGATFYFSLPTMDWQRWSMSVPSGAATTLERDQQEVPDQERPAGAEEQDQVGPVIILTADGRTKDAAGPGTDTGDVTEPEERDLWTYLTARGYTVREITVTDDQAPEDPAYWLNQILLSAPSALILDMAPASEQGWTLMKLLKENPRTQKIPVLFYSLLQESDSGSVLSLDYLTKPISMADLARVLAHQGMVGGFRATDQTYAKAGDAHAGGSSVCSSVTFLIVDDEPNILATHTWMLQSQLPGSRILQAANGREALEVMTTVHPDLVLLDLMMPEMSGFDVITSMQQHPDLCDIPVVVLTAKTLSQEEITRLNQGVTRILSKGLFTIEETLRHLESALQRNQDTNLEVRRIVRRAVAYIHEHYMEPIVRKEIAGYVNLSPRHLDRCFSEELDITPIAYLNRFRLQQARRLLEDTELNISEVAAAVGFSDSSYFCRVFRRDMEMSPSDYRRNRTK